MKTSLHLLITTAFAAMLPLTASASGTMPIISLPADGAKVSGAVKFVVNASGLTHYVKTVTIRSNGTPIGAAAPTSFNGEWSFPGDAHLSVMLDPVNGGFLDYHPDAATAMFTMDGQLAASNQFAGTFDHWGNGHQTGNCTATFNFDKNGQLKAVLDGDSPLGKRTHVFGKTMGADYGFTWRKPTGGSQKIDAVVTYINSLGGTNTHITDPINLTVKKFPEIEVRCPKTKLLTDGKSTVKLANAKVGKRKVKTVVIKNRGTAKLTGIKVQKKGAAATDYLVTKPGKSSLAPNESTTFKVVFRPKKKGNRVATLRIRSNDANENPFDIRLIGKGR